MQIRTILLGLLALAVSFAAASYGMRLLAPEAGYRPALAETPPLPPVTRTSTVVAPVVIALPVIRDAMEAQTPHNFAGKRDTPISPALANADIAWTVERGPLAVAGAAQTLSISTALNGTLHATGRLSSQAAGSLGNAIGGLLGGDAGREAQRLANRGIDQRADIRGNITLTARPALAPTWRLELNLAAQVTISDGGLNLAGVRLNVANEVKPLLDRSIANQVNAVEAKLRNDPFLEQAARREWGRLCRAFPLGGRDAGLPPLWLELRPTRAFAAQPRIDAAALTLTIGIEAQTRLIPTETHPDCPFPATIEIVPPPEQGRVSIAVPITVPFADVNRLIEARLAGRTFAQDSHDTFPLTVQHASVAPSGDRLLISLRVRAREEQSLFQFGGEANVYVWGKPLLDPTRQVLRLTDITLDVASGGFLGTGIRATLPLIETAIEENAIIDLKPFAADARRSIEAALDDFRAGGDGVRVDAAVTGLRLVELAFDATTLRVIAEADATARVAVDAIPGISNQ